MESNKTTSTSIGLGTILFVVFLVMKLAKIGDVANWSWWWVTAPLWIPVLLALAVFSIALLIFAIFKRK
jgi:hypothetical protein